MHYAPLKHKYAVLDQVEGGQGRVCLPYIVDWFEGQERTAVTSKKGMKIGKKSHMESNGERRVGE